MMLMAISMIGSVATLYAQRPGGPPPGVRGGKAAPKTGYGKFSGIVKDEEGEVIPYATIRLLSGEDKKLVNGTIADEDGKWVFRNVAEGDFHVSISFISYKTIEMGPYKVTGKGESYNLGNIVLESSATELDQVVVEGEKELIEDRGDRIV